MPQMTLFFTLSRFFEKHTQVSIKLAGCPDVREKEEKKGHVNRVRFKYPENRQRSPFSRK